jgi:type IX secretion system PorP/SprF family membrane protein
MDNLAGRSNYSTFNCIVGGSYSVTAPESKDHYLTTGLQLGIINRKFGMDDLLFTSQYTTGQGMNSSIDNGENFQKVSILRFDANIGFYYKYRNPFSKYNPFIGFSIYHLNKPDQSVTGLSNKMPMRFNVNLGSDIYVKEDINIKPSILYMYQGKAQELNLGLLLYYHMKNTEYDIIAGASYRWKDAVAIHLGIKQAQSTFRISYDMVTSCLFGFQKEIVFGFFDLITSHNPIFLSWFTRLNRCFFGKFVRNECVYDYLETFYTFDPNGKRNALDRILSFDIISPNFYN